MVICLSYGFDYGVECWCFGFSDGMETRGENPMCLEVKVAQLHPGP